MNDIFCAGILGLESFQDPVSTTGVGNELLVSHILAGLQRERREVSVDLTQKIPVWFH